MRKSIALILILVCVSFAQRANAGQTDVLNKMQDHADKLAQSGDSAGALKEYVELWNKSHDFPEWGGVRNSFLIGDILRFASTYPPTLDALRDLRDNIEARILAGKATEYDYLDWTTLNSSLRDRKRSLAVYDQLHEKKIVIPDELTQMILPELVSQKRYAEAHNAAISEAKYELTRLPELRGYRGSPNGLQHILSSRYPVYECLIASNELALAKQLEKQLVKVSNTKATYDGLIAAAERAGNEEIVAELKSASINAK